ncbi:MAG: cyclic-di-AMP receptor [Oscillospiraceae bacterium]|jgi:uncharacterized protein YaaQ|nr:cyclic-di-AMP receptor [Oscillospiraceae bacterium]
MKLLIAITGRADAPAAASAIAAAGYHSTVTDSFGGFLREENALILCAVDDSKVSAVLKIIGENTFARTTEVPPDALGGSFKLPPRIQVGRAVVFTLAVDQFFKL